MKSSADSLVGEQSSGEAEYVESFESPGLILRQNYAKVQCILKNGDLQRRAPNHLLEQRQLGWAVGPSSPPTQIYPKHSSDDLQSARISHDESISTAESESGELGSSPSVGLSLEPATRGTSLSCFHLETMLTLRPIYDSRTPRYTHCSSLYWRSAYGRCRSLLSVHLIMTQSRGAANEPKTELGRTEPSAKVSVSGILGVKQAELQSDSSTTDPIDREDATLQMQKFPSIGNRERGE